MQSASAKWNDDRLGVLTVEFDRFKVDVDGRFEQVDRRFAEVDRRFDQVDQQFTQVDRRFEQVDRRFASLEDEVRGGFREVRTQIAQLNNNLLRISILYGASILGLFGALLLRGGS